MVISVRLIGPLRNALDKDKFAVQIKTNMQLKDFIEKTFLEQPKLKQALIAPQFKDRGLNALILINGKEASILKGLQTIVKDRDKITLIQVLHGG